MYKKYSLCESKRFNGWEGEVYSPLFGVDISFTAKHCEEIFVRRCAEFFEELSLERLAEFPAVEAVLKALGDYLVDFLDEHRDEFDLGEFSFDKDQGVCGVLKAVIPESVSFERLVYLTDEECPVAFAMKLCFAPVPDEIMEIALHGDISVYAGEYRRISPWNESILNKKWNYVRGI